MPRLHHHRKNGRHFDASCLYVYWQNAVERQRISRGYCTNGKAELWQSSTQNLNKALKTLQCSKLPWINLLNISGLSANTTVSSYSVDCLLQSGFPPMNCIQVLSRIAILYEYIQELSQNTNTVHNHELNIFHSWHVLGMSAISYDWSNNYIFVNKFISMLINCFWYASQ